MEPIGAAGKEMQFQNALCVKDRKYRMIWILGTYSGLRISDLLNLKVKQITPVMTVKEAKTGKSKNITLSEKILTEITEYVRAKKLEPGHYLFPRHDYEKDKPIGRIQTWRVISRTASEMGLKSIGTHSMRKTYAQNLYATTGDITVVQKHLNHKDAITTLAYLDGKGKKLVIVDE
jgi:integrase